MNVPKRVFLMAVVLAGIGGCAMMSPGSSPGSSAGSSAVQLGATLSGGQEVPPVTTSGTGTLTATFHRQTNKLNYRVTYSGLSGPATGAHFHGPAASGQNAGVVVGFQRAESPIEGEATLTSAQAADLLAGRWYVNVHTARHPGGEIRGQVTSR